MIIHRSDPYTVSEVKKFMMLKRGRIVQEGETELLYAGLCSIK